MSDNRPFKSMDANAAAGHVAYAYTEVAAIYPITPSSPMAEHAGRVGQPRTGRTSSASRCRVVEMESAGRRRRRGPRVPVYRGADHHLHRLPGLAR